MPAKKIQLLLTLLFLSITTFGQAQIVTSKKEAVKKGIYQKPIETKKAETDKPKAIAAAVPVAESKGKEVKEIKSVKPVAKPKKNILNDTEDTDLASSPIENYVGMQMINNAMGFLGVRYHGGGTTSSGMDCSGMVTAVFNIFEMKLPRSSHDMAKVGQKIDTKDVQKGDLIFFRTNGRKVINHVGMVVEVLEDEIKFIHSSTQSGVIISSTKEPYYKRSFAQVNRVL